MQHTGEIAPGVRLNVACDLLRCASGDNFATPVAVPAGFVEDALAIPPPKGKTLYIRLRDDPATIDTVTLPMLTAQP